MKRYAAISADIVASTSWSRASLVEFADKIKDVLSQIEQNYKGFWGRLVRGDSIECVTEHPEQALRIAIMLKSFAKSFNPTTGMSSLDLKQYGLRLAIGVGEMRINNKEEDIMDGEAIYLSGRALADMQDKTADSLQIVMSHDMTNGALAVIAMLLNQTINKATRRQCETLFHKLQCKIDAEVAQRMHISRSGANNNLRNMGWEAVERAIKYFEQLDFDRQQP